MGDGPGSGRSGIWWQAAISLTLPCPDSRHRQAPEQYGSRNSAPDPAPGADASARPASRECQPQRGSQEQRKPLRALSKPPRRALPLGHGRNPGPVKRLQVGGGQAEFQDRTIGLLRDRLQVRVNPARQHLFTLIAEWLVPGTRGHRMALLGVADRHDMNDDPSLDKAVEP